MFYGRNFTILLFLAFCHQKHTVPSVLEVTKSSQTYSIKPNFQKRTLISKEKNREAVDKEGGKRVKQEREGRNHWEPQTYDSCRNLKKVLSDITKI